MTQANIEVLDAHSNELDAMLEDAKYEPLADVGDEGDMEWLEADSTIDSNDMSDDMRETVVYENSLINDEFERQADELDLGEQSNKTPGQGNNVSSSHEDDSSLPEVAAAAAGVPAMAAAAGDLPQNTDPLAFEPVDEGPFARQNLPLDLTEGRKGKKFSIFRRDQKARAIRHGVSWSAMVLTLPYLIYRGLFGTAIAYTMLWFIAIGGLIVSGMAWLDAPENVTPIIQGATIGFALLAIIGLFLIPFAYANRWRRNKLENRGFELVAIAKAKNSGKAISRARRHAAFE